MSDEPLPGVLADIERVAGRAAALQLGAALGGQRVKIPGLWRPGLQLTGIVGEEAARKIVAHYAVTNADGRAVGTELDLPIAGFGSLGRALRQARRAVSDAIASGASLREAARAGGVTVRGARKMKRRMRGGTRDQGSLF